MGSLQQAFLIVSGSLIWASIRAYAIELPKHTVKSMKHVDECIHLNTIAHRTIQSHYMLPLSVRLPDDLYEWLAIFPMEGATTVSDKLRLAVAHLRRTQGGAADYLGTLAMYRDLGRSTRESVAQLAQSSGQHSEVLAALLEHIPALTAALHSAPLNSVDDAKQLEAQLVGRTLQLAETLLRQAVTQQAAAYDPQVIAKHSARLLELARVLPS